MKFFNCILFLCFIQISIYAQLNNTNYDSIIQPNIKTVLLHDKNWESSEAILDLAQPTPLLLSFDELGNQKKNYTISFQHCDAYWQPSNLLATEYISGYLELNINEYTFSENTTQSYVHYQVEFPQDNLMFTKSGNYVAYVYLNGDKNQIIFTKRFVVLNSKVSISTSVREAIKQIEQSNSKQQLDFELNIQALHVINSNQEIITLIQQNHRWDKTTNNLEPTFINQNKLTFLQNEEASFESGNEFRLLDVQSLLSTNRGVFKNYSDSLFQKHALLETDRQRRGGSYVLTPDLNGGLHIHNRDFNLNKKNSSDYVWAHFSLKFRNVDSLGSIYLMGKLGNWQKTALNKMRFNTKCNCYEVKLLLKQGLYFYNYEYVKHTDKKSSVYAIEGSFWETENDYTILVYYRERGTRYDQLVGLKNINSIKQ